MVKAWRDVCFPPRRGVLYIKTDVLNTGIILKFALIMCETQMSKTINTIIAIILVGLFPALSLYVGTQGNGYTKENAVLIATQFLKGSPTYSFDGIEDSIEVISVDTVRMPYSWMITIKFTSRNGGYGDRTDQMVLTVLTLHEMVILVQEDQVIWAKTDGKFDEINEVFLD